LVLKAKPLKCLTCKRVTNPRPVLDDSSLYAWHILKAVATAVKYFHLISSRMMVLSMLAVQQPGILIEITLYNLINLVIS
jgi:hypothetical protein